MLGAIINLFYPALCKVCSKKINEFNHNICGDCAKKIKERLPPFCMKCGRQLKGDPELIATCQGCKKDTPHFDRAWSACRYDDPLKGLIHDFKYKKITSLSTDFTALIINFMKKYNVGGGCQIILSIPMHPNRLFRREINHSDILAQGLGKCLGISYSGNTLKKTKDTLLQSKLKREARIKNLHSSFSLKNNSIVRNKNILLVDDLFTTGSTVNECSRLLKNSGARYVEVITLARGDSL
ncbi:MAG: ComF family protein [Candidatus Omnitrophota bacterium]|nr:ComF family protein [Candidatus Omnitrophota bacterium]